VLIGLNLFDGDAASAKRQSEACAALAALDGIEAVNVQFEDGESRADQRIATLSALAVDSAHITGTPGRRKPIAVEMFDVLASAAASRGYRYFAYINSDIVVTRALLEQVQGDGKETYAVSRCDVGGHADDRMITAGQDMFVVSVGWWEANRWRFRPYIVGEACWDNVYTAVMMCHSKGALLNRDPLILHERHPAVWRDATPAARYNGYLAALDARYFDLWAQYWHRLEELRAADAPPAAEAALAREVFVWKRSVRDALRQFVRGVRARRRYHRLRAEWMTAAVTA
jgi:hypothetical protein